MSEYDVAKVRAHFPALESGLAFFDGPGGSQTPDVVGEAVRSTLVGPLSNRGDLTVAQDNAERAVVEARAALGDLLGAAPDGVVFGRSFTQLTFDVSRAMAKEWGPDDEVVVTRLDHDGNVRPVGDRRRGGRRHRAVGRLRPGDRRALDGVAGGRPHQPDQAGRGHRRLQPDRDPARPARGRGAGARGRCVAVRRRGAPHPARQPVAGASRARTSWAARRTSSSARTPAWWPDGWSCWSGCTRTSWCPRRTRCPNGSSSGRCPTS